MPTVPHVPSSKHTPFTQSMSRLQNAPSACLPHVATAQIPDAHWLSEAQPVVPSANGALHSCTKQMPELQSPSAPQGAPLARLVP
jgi:hypothetical protein